MKKVQQSIWEMLDGRSKASNYYDIVMMAIIVVSLVPLIFKQETAALLWIDRITAALFIADYILRWCTVNLKLRKGWKSFLLYPVTPWALLDLVCILPSFRIMASGFRILKVARIRILRVFRFIRHLQNTRGIKTITDVLKDQLRPLMTVLGIALGYVVIVALVMFNVEPDTFNNFFHAIYWSTISLTTIGYGDVYPQSTLGQIITILSSFVGVAIIALPSGIIAGGFMDELRKSPDEEPNTEETDTDTVKTPLAVEEPAERAGEPLSQIEKLGDLYKKGLLTEEEFSSKKTELLDRL